MKPQILPLLLLSLLLFAGTSQAKEVHLGIGETFREGDLTVKCGDAAGPAQATTPLSVQDCQYWDDYEKKCLFEKTVFTYKNLQCIEECLHWDAYAKTCNYQTRCAFYPGQEAFVRRTCLEYDDYSHKCLKTGEVKIGP